MDYRIFAKEHYNITALDSREISDPVVGLKEFLVGKSEESLKQDVQDLLIAVFEENGWRKHGTPINLYRKTKDVAKLMDFVWLIVSCLDRELVKPANVEKHYLYRQYQQRTFSRLFHNTPRKVEGKTVSAVALAKAIFDRRFGLLLKDDLAEVWLNVSFNASYMRNLTTDFHCIESSTDVQDYRYLFAIIDGAFELAEQPELRCRAEALAYYQLFATDADHPDVLFKETIEDPIGCFEGPFFYVDAARFPDAIRTWYSLIFQTGHWVNHSDPGNILYVREVVQRFLETGWLLLRVGFPKQGLSVMKRKYIKDLSALEVADPIAYVRHCFERHRLHEWKHLLEVWLCQSLSDEDHVDAAVTEQDCESIVKLMQALHLIRHRAIA